MNKFGLPQRAMDEMHAIFAKHSKVKKVVLYGSRAMGNYKNGSDIDLTMYGSALTFDDLNNIAGELEESSIPYLVDLSIFYVLDHAKLKDHIKRHGRVFYDRYAEWKTVKLGDVCDLFGGGTPKSNEKTYWGEEIQWLTPKDMGKLQNRYVATTERQITKSGLENSSAKVIPKKSIILSCRAPIGHVAINEVPMSFNQGCKGLVPKSKMLTEYLYYFLFASKDFLNSLGTGATFKEISRKTLANVELQLPPLADQQRIVAKLDAAFAEIDTAIEITRQREDTLKSLKSSILLGELENKDS